jgi:hypothetical protein
MFDTAQLARRINESGMQESLIVGADLVQIMNQGGQTVGIEPTKLRLDGLPGWPRTGWLCSVFQEGPFEKGRGPTFAMSRGASASAPRRRLHRGVGRRAAISASN